MLLRALDPSDANAFQALRLRGLQDCPSAFASSYEEERDIALAEVEHRLRPQSDAVIFGAFQGGQLCAVVGLRRERQMKLSHKAFIWGLYVSPEARGQGIGTQLMRMALKCAIEQLHVRQVNLGVNTTNAAAIALYKKLGFSEFGLERGYLSVAGKLHDEYQMVWYAPSAT
jgi:ribosomal protein S18 acetylase RimI-like enzyme